LLSGTSWVNNTAEAGTDNGTPFGLMSHSSNELYIGDSTTFNGVDLNFSTLGYGYNLRAYYFSGTWVQLSTVSSNLNDDTSNFTSNGRISFNIPTDWISGTFNGVSNRWLKLTTDTSPIATAQAYYVRPDDSVRDLLSLSSDDILDGNWAWCYFNNYAYLTLKNRGGLGYEGNEWVRIESNDTNKKNYFVYNHSLAATYMNSTWSQWKGASSGNYAYQQKMSRIALSGTGSSPPVVCLLSGTVDVTNASRVTIEPYAYMAQGSSPCIFMVQKNASVLYSGTYSSGNMLLFSPTVVDANPGSGNTLYSLNFQTFTTGSTTVNVDFGTLSIQTTK
jgi:hypothetical protein